MGVLCVRLFCRDLRSGFCRKRVGVAVSGYVVVQRHWANERDEWRIVLDKERYETKEQARRAIACDANRWYPDAGFSRRSYLSHFRILPEGVMFNAFGAEPLAEGRE